MDPFKKKVVVDELLKDVDNISEDGSFIRQSLPDRLNPNKWHQKPNENPPKTCIL